LIFEGLLWPAKLQDVANIAVKEIFAAAECKTGVLIGTIETGVSLSAMWVAGLGKDKYGLDLRLRAISPVKAAGHVSKLRCPSHGTAFSSKC
jgi:hypothetical protein